jgi:branched-chain amino acid transport system ATP-binding protein
MTALVELIDVNTYYGASHVLHDVSLSIRPGETLSLMGRNGMGKTTTLRSLVGLTPPKRGEVRVKGQRVSGLPTHKVIRRGIGFVPEDRGIFSSLTVRENLQMAARPGVDGRRDWSYDRVLETFPRLAERLDNMGNQLSGGEQQMLTIGRALMTNPELLILDEATEGLAPLIRKEIWAVVRAIKATGIATLIVDKDIKALLALCDRCLVMVKGRIKFDGPAAELAAQPELQHQYLGV